MFCVNCGQRYESSHRFCKHCGIALLCDVGGSDSQAGTGTLACSDLTATPVSASQDLSIQDVGN